MEHAVVSSLLENTLQEFKRKLARQLMGGFALLVAIACPLSLSRAFEIGFQPIFILHVLVTIVVFACHFRPNKSNYKLDYIVLIVIFSALIIGGITSYGLQSGVITFATFTSFLFAILWGLRPAIWFSIAWFFFVIGVGYLFINGIIDYVVPPEVYSATYGSWLIVAVGSCLSITQILIGSYHGYDQLSKQLKKIEIQKLEIEYLANHDTLTGYSSARLAMPILENTIHQAKRSGTKVAVVFMDLNKFKEINDRYGHNIGDAVLAKSATLLKQDIRDMDSAVRVGGDEFLFILPNIQNTATAMEIVQRQINRLSSLTRINDVPIKITASAGIAIYPEDSEDPMQLRSFADKAMYALKQRRDTHIKLYSDYALEKFR